jgi:hypothetical protein
VVPKRQSKETKIDYRNGTYQYSQPRYVDGFNNREQPFRIVELAGDRKTAQPAKKVQKVQAPYFLDIEIN